jgi:hypothetical protein
MGKHHKRGKGKRESQLLEVERAQRNASADDAEGVGSVGDSGDEDGAARGWTCLGTNLAPL